MTQIIEPELSYKITGLCFKAQKKLGRFASERQYVDEMVKLLSGAGIEFSREFEIKNFEPGAAKGNRVDLFIARRVLFDAKAKKFVTKEDYDQMVRYLYASCLKLGLIVNFRSTYLKPKRVLNNRV